MKITALWNALRGQPQQASGQDEAKQEQRRRIRPCSLEEMDARLKALDEFLHEGDAKKAQETKPQPPTVQRPDPRKDPNALRTWFVLKSLNDEENKAT